VDALGQASSRVKNQLQHIAMNEGFQKKRQLWTEDRGRHGVSGEPEVAPWTNGDAMISWRKLSGEPQRNILEESAKSLLINLLADMRCEKDHKTSGRYI